MHCWPLKNAATSFREYRVDAHDFYAWPQQVADVYGILTNYPHNATEIHWDDVSPLVFITPTPHNLCISPLAVHLDLNIEDFGT
jgi:hypothetical protein